jgi:hypothetical protein
VNERGSVGAGAAIDQELIGPHAQQVESEGAPGQRAARYRVCAGHTVGAAKFDHPAFERRSCPRVDDDSADGHEGLETHAKDKAVEVNAESDLHGGRSGGIGRVGIKDERREAGALLRLWIDSDRVPANQVAEGCREPVFSGRETEEAEAAVLVRYRCDKTAAIGFDGGPGYRLAGVG